MTTSDPRNITPTGTRSIPNDGPRNRRHRSKASPSREAFGGSLQDSVQPSTRDHEQGSEFAPRADPQSELKSRRARAKPPAIETCADLLRLVYGGKRRINPKKAEIDAMRAGREPERSEREDLLDLARSDRTLVRTRELILFSLERFDMPRLVAQIQQFVGEALKQHPAFQAKRLDGVLENRTDGPAEAEAVRFLSSQPFGSLPWPEGVAALKKTEAELCRVNALICLLLWFRETRGTSFERILWYLQSSVFAPLAKRHRKELQKLKVLVSSRDRAGIAVAFAIHEMRVQREAQIAASARRAEEQAAKRARVFQDRVTQLEIDLKSARADVAVLSKTLDSTKRDHDNERAYLRDDYEQMRGRVVRRLREEVALLNEGLHALRRDPPKVHVMEDHADRAIDRLKRELERLKRED